MAWGICVVHLNQNTLLTNNSHGIHSLNIILLQYVSLEGWTLVAIMACRNKVKFSVCLPGVFNQRFPGEFEKRINFTTATFAALKIPNEIILLKTPGKRESPPNHTNMYENPQKTSSEETNKGNSKNYDRKSLSPIFPTAS